MKRRLKRESNMCNKAGYITVSRKLFEHEFWKEKRTYSKAEAWLDLIALAFYKKSETLVNNTIIQVDRGQLVASIRFLSDRWQWSKGRVTRFINYLVIHDMVEKSVGHQRVQQRVHQRVQQRVHPITLLTICNYDSYNKPKKVDGYTDEDTNGYRVGYTDEDKENKYNEVNKYNKENILKENSSKFQAKKFMLEICQNEELIDEWLKVRKSKKAVNTKIALTKFKNQIEKAKEKYKITAEQIIQICVEKSWRGFEADWLEKDFQSKKSKSPLQHQNQREITTDKF